MVLGFWKQKSGITDDATGKEYEILGIGGSWFGVERQPDGELKFAWQRDWFDLGSTATTFLAIAGSGKAPQGLLDRMGVNGKESRATTPTTSCPRRCGRRRSSAATTSLRGPPRRPPRDGSCSAAARRRQAGRRERRQDLPDPQPCDRRRDRPGARRDRGGRRGRGGSRASRLRRDRLVDQPRAAGPLPAAAAPGAARPRRRLPRAHHRRGGDARVHAGRGRFRRSGRGTQVGRRPRRDLRLRDRPRRRVAHGDPEPADGTPRAGRRRRRHHAVERAHPDQPRQGRSGAGRRLHGGAQARPGHALAARASSGGWPPSTPTSLRGCSTW